ncbi:MAG: hypothetical protein KDE20_26760, partial [Caldilineaceae bacterium]|nr:hypothetical protein [Caldilineaceae bacterium]
MISTVAGLLVGFVFVFSISVLFRYFFLGPNPLDRNTLARVEAGQKPEVLRDLWREYRRRRFVGILAIITFVYFVILAISQPAANLILD